MTLAHPMELQPTVTQQQYFTQACGPARFTWNGALAEWNRQYRAGLKPKAPVRKRQFEAIQYQQFPWLEGVHRDAHAQPLAALAAAWRNFLEGRGKRPKSRRRGNAGSRATSPRINSPSARKA